MNWCSWWFWHPKPSPAPFTITLGGKESKAQARMEVSLLLFLVLMSACCGSGGGRYLLPYLREEAETREVGWFAWGLTAGVTAGLQSLSPGSCSNIAFRNKVWKKSEQPVIALLLLDQLSAGHTCMLTMLTGCPSPAPSACPPTVPRGVAGSRRVWSAATTETVTEFSWVPSMWQTTLGFHGQLNGSKK